MRFQPPRFSFVRARAFAVLLVFGMLLLAHRGMFDARRLVHDCEHGRFPLIVNEHRLERIPGFGQCLETYYEPAGDLATYRLFRPRVERANR